MAWTAVLNGNTYTEDSFSGTNYAIEDTGLPGALRDVVAHSRDVIRANSADSINLSTLVVSNTLSITTGTDKFFEVGGAVLVSQVSNPANYVFGYISLYNASTGSLDLTIEEIAGSATDTNWVLSLGIGKVSSSASADASAASASASASASSASAANTDASEAAASAAASLINKNATDAIYEEFDARYLGPYAADPTLDNEGSALLSGAIYWNTVVPELKVYDLGGASWAAVGVWAPASQIEMEEGTETNLRAIAPLRVMQAVYAEWDRRLLGFNSNTRHDLFTGDLNTLIYNSTYKVDTAGVSNEPAGSSGGGFVTTMVDSVSSAAARQLFIGLQSNEVFVRNRIGSTWNAWTPGLDLDGEYLRIDTTGSQTILSDVVLGEGTGLEGGSVSLVKSPSGTNTVNPSIEVYSDGIRIVTDPGGSPKSLSLPAETGLVLHTNNVGGIAHSFTAEQTFKETKNTQYNLVGTSIDPANGYYQYVTLASSVTFTYALEDGQSVLLFIQDGTGYLANWPTTSWVGGSAPTLSTTLTTIIELWQVNGTIYGSQVGDA